MCFGFWHLPLVSSNALAPSMTHCSTSFALPQFPRLGKNDEVGVFLRVYLHTSCCSSVTDVCLSPGREETFLQMLLIKTLVLCRHLSADIFLQALLFRADEKTVSGHKETHRRARIENDGKRKENQERQPSIMKLVFPVRVLRIVTPATVT